MYRSLLLVLIIIYYHYNIITSLSFQLWDLASGHLLRSFVFNVAIFAVVMDAAEYRLFAGGYDGKVFVINLFCKVRSTLQCVSF